MPFIWTISQSVTFPEASSLAFASLSILRVVSTPVSAHEGALQYGWSWTNAAPFEGWLMPFACRMQKEV